jgi:hypothetical protein
MKESEAEWLLSSENFEARVASFPGAPHAWKFSRIDERAKSHEAGGLNLL